MNVTLICFDDLMLDAVTVAREGRFRFAKKLTQFLHGKSQQLCAIKGHTAFRPAARELEVS